MTDEVQQKVFQTHDKELFDVFADAVKEGVAIVRKLEAEKKYIGNHYKFPSVSYQEDGMPSFSMFGNQPVDYGNPFGLRSSATVNCNDIPAIKNFIEFAKNKDYIQKHYKEFYREPPSEFDFFDTLILLLFTNVIDRYMNIHKGKEFEIELFIPIYEPIENGIFNEKLEINILIPILMLGFDFDFLKLNDNSAITRMNDETQLSRAGKTDSAPEIHWVVANKASHAILFTNYSIENKGYSTVFNLLASATTYPIDKVEEFLAALRIVTGLNTGYAQILAQPTNWAFDYKAFLSPLHGAVVRAYPNHFDNGYWLKPTEIITEKQAEKVINIYNQILAINNNRIRIALRRLNTCLLRDNDEDRILDAAIGLEALFADDEKQEMTHKLALRVAVISKIATTFNYTPTQVFSAVKKIYSYRSAIAHGSRDADKKREVDINGNKISTIELAIEFLRNSLIVLLENPKYLTSTTIDEELLLG